MCCSCRFLLLFTVALFSSSRSLFNNILFRHSLPSSLLLLLLFLLLLLLLHPLQFLSHLPVFLLDSPINKQMIIVAGRTCSCCLPLLFLFLVPNQGTLLNKFKHRYHAHSITAHDLHTPSLSLFSPS